MVLELFSYVFAASLYYLVEVLWAVSTDRGLPVGWGHLAGGWAVALVWTLLVGSCYWALARRRRRLTVVLGAVGSLTIVLAKLVAVDVSSGGSFTVLYLFLTVGLALGIWFWRAGPREAVHWWGLVLVVSGLISTDVLKVLWFVTRSGTFEHVLRGLGIVLVGGVVLALGDRIWGPVRRTVEAHPAWALGVLVVVGAGAGFTWSATQEIPAGDREAHASLVEQARRRVGDVRLSGGRTVEDLPNIIVISIDTLRWDMVPPRAKMHGLELPNLRKLREDSVVFPNAYSTSSWTLPAHASLFSGLPSVKHGGVLKEWPMYSSVVLYPELLKSLGYRTAAFTDGGPVNDFYGFDRGHEIYWEHFDSAPSTLTEGYRDFVPGAVESWLRLYGGPVSLTSAIRQPRRTDDTTGHGDDFHWFRRNLNLARRWVQSVSYDRRPFYLFLHTFQVHDYGAPREVNRLIRERYPYLYPDRSVTPGSGPPEVRDASDITEERLWKNFRNPSVVFLPPRLTRRFRTRVDGLSASGKQLLLQLLRQWWRGGDPVYRFGQRHVRSTLVEFSDTQWRAFSAGSPSRQRRMLGRHYRFMLVESERGPDGAGNGSSESPSTREEILWKRFLNPPSGRLDEDERRRFQRRIQELPKEDRNFLRRVMEQWARDVHFSDSRVLSFFQRRFGRWSREEWEAIWDRPHFRLVQALEQVHRVEVELLGLPFLKHRRHIRRRISYKLHLRDVDREIGRFTDFLQRRGLYDSSVIVFLSDHGEGFLLETEAFRHNAGQLNEILLKVPLWIKLPKSVDSGPTQFPGRKFISGVFPYLMDRFGIKSVRGIQATPSDTASLGSVTGGSIYKLSIPQEKRLKRAKVSLGKRARYFVYAGDYKLTWEEWSDRRYWWRVHPRSVREDPVVIDDIPSRDRDKLRKRMRSFRRMIRNNPDPFDRPEKPMDPDLKKELRGLGYF